MGVLATDLGAVVILDLNAAVGRLQALGEGELDLARRPLELALRRRLGPLKPAMAQFPTQSRHSSRNSSAPRADRCRSPTKIISERVLAGGWRELAPNNYSLGSNPSSAP